MSDPAREGTDRPHGTGVDVGRSTPSIGEAGLDRPGWSASDSTADEVRSGLRVGWQGILLILGFWTFFGVVMAASLFLSPLRDSPEAAPAALIIFTFLGAYTWAGLTLPLFWLTRRLGLTEKGGVQRAIRVVGLLGFSLVLAIVVSLGLAFVSSVVLQDLLGGNLAGTEGMWRMARYRFLNDLLACHLVLTAGVARDYFLRYRARNTEAMLLRSQLVEARLQVLRTQLNPHFLFNTLNAVATLVTSDPRGVRRMIARLSELLRHTLEGAAEPEVPLSQELEVLTRYLDIMEIRFGDRLETEVETEPGVSEALVPNLILQPLVENAMKHGVGRSAGPARVRVRVRREEDDLVLTVRDGRIGDSAAGEILATPPSEADRAGSEKEAPGSRDGASSAAASRGGFGLRQTRERLDQLYGTRGRLRLVTLEDRGAIAEVRIPFHTRRMGSAGSATPATPPDGGRVDFGTRDDSGDRDSPTRSSSHA